MFYKTVLREPQLHLLIYLLDLLTDGVRNKKGFSQGK